jgi:hypothetical protein
MFDGQSFEPHTDLVAFKISKVELLREFLFNTNDEITFPMI